MTVLNGGLPKRANESIEDFVALFIDHITPSEWRLVAQLPPIAHVTELVAVIVKIRSEDVLARAHRGIWAATPKVANP